MWLHVPGGDPERPVDGDHVDPVVGGVHQQRRRGGHVPGADHAVDVVVSGGTDTGGDAVKTPTMTANGVAHQSVSTNGSPLSGAPPIVRTPLPTRQRRVGWTTLGAVLVVGLGLVFGYLYSTAGSKEPVVMVTAAVAVGAVIDRSDLSTVDVAGDITAIAGANLESVVGQRAAVALLPGTVLQRSMVTDADPIPSGMAQVGVAVKGGQLPADGLVPGDRVQVLALPGQAAGAALAGTTRVSSAVPGWVGSWWAANTTAESTRTVGAGGFPAPAACPGRASTCTRSPGTNPSAGSCPPFTATPTLS